MAVKRISPEIVRKLAPITEQIDRELEKDQAERVDFKIETDAASTLKNHLETYKAQLRQDWNGRFQMWKSKGCLEIRFGVHKTLNFRIAKPAELPEFTVIPSSETFTTGVPLEVDDLAVAGMLLELTSPLIVSKRSLTEETIAWVNNPLNAEPTGVILTAQRLGYSIVNLGDRVRFTTGG